MTPPATLYPALTAARASPTRDEERERLREFIAAKQSQKHQDQWGTEPESCSEVRAAKRRLLELGKAPFEIDEDISARAEEMMAEREERDRRQNMWTKTEDRAWVEHTKRRRQSVEGDDSSTVEGQQGAAGRGGLESVGLGEVDIPGALEAFEPEDSATPFQEPIPASEQPWREEGREPFRTNGFEQWTELFPTWAFPCQHPWDVAGWTANFLAEFGAHSSICPDCEGCLEATEIRSWDSGNLDPRDDLWINQLSHNESVPRVEKWLEGHPVVAGDGGELGEWDNPPLGAVHAVETSVAEMHQHQAEAQLLREKDEFGPAVYDSGEDSDYGSGEGSDYDSDEEGVILLPKLTAEERKARLRPNEDEEPADFQLRYETFVYHLDAVEHLKKFGTWPEGYCIPDDD